MCTRSQPLTFSRSPEQPSISLRLKYVSVSRRDTPISYHAREHTHTIIHMHMHTHSLHNYAHANIHTHAYILTHTHAYIHTHTQHTYIHMYVHAKTHIHMHASITTIHVHHHIIIAGARQPAVPHNGPPSPVHSGLLHLLSVRPHPVSAAEAPPGADPAALLPASLARESGRTFRVERAHAEGLGGPTGAEEVHRASDARICGHQELHGQRESVWVLDCVPEELQ